MSLRTHWLGGRWPFTKPATVSLVTAALYCFALDQGLPNDWAAFGAIGIGFVLRLLAVRFKWGLPTFNYQYATH